MSCVLILVLRNYEQFFLTYFFSEFFEKRKRIIWGKERIWVTNFTVVVISMNAEEKVKVENLNAKLRKARNNKLESASLHRLSTSIATTNFMKKSSW